MRVDRAMDSTSRGDSVLLYKVLYMLSTYCEGIIINIKPKDVGIPCFNWSWGLSENIGKSEGTSWNP